MLRLRDIHKTRGAGSQRYSLRIPRLDLAAGQQLAVVGPSGCGKSTLLDLLALVLSPDASGEFSVELDGGYFDIAALWRGNQHDALARLRRQACGYVLQTGGLLEFLDVRGNIELPRRLLQLPMDGRVEQLAAHLEIADYLGKRPNTLSVGQRQRVSIARALAHGPRLVLADEPTASLDPANAQRVMQLLVQQAQVSGTCTVIATHDEPLVRSAGLAVLPIDWQRDADGGVTATLGQWR
ncbi:ABC transporter ATP-binding protein [Pseudomonas turukhanskensis]|uniref:ABC transporter ATP-binding protein n=1 Tax=Pseudomonas turukhanskensis TaxID=1806536 RepID=A0A9W6NE63_9PSED|nr:ABC transporter ATP-binding protein [Pseudomonas turukhanskensis]GLK88359.1 ABC transporter ATP-binding protein [Pseudomonas turukhanskensis]